MAAKESKIVINDRLLYEVVKYGHTLADMCARVNWQQIEAIEERDAEEFGKKLAEKLTDLKVETRRQSYGFDTAYANGAEVLRAVLRERGEEPEFIDTVVRTLEYAFAARREAARVGRRKLDAALRKTQPDGHTYAANCTRGNT